MLTWTDLSVEGSFSSRHDVCQNAQKPKHCSTLRIEYGTATDTVFLFFCRCLDASMTARRGMHSTPCLFESSLTSCHARRVGRSLRRRALLSRFLASLPREV